jgi:hypothetical protein
MPEQIVFCFTLLERQFATADITGDEDRATALLGSLDKEYLMRVEDVTMNLSPTGHYDRLKEELLRILAKTDSEKMTRLVENEVMGDRKPSQFYLDLTKLASPYASEHPHSSSRFGGTGYPLEYGKFWLW